MTTTGICEWCGGPTKRKGDRGPAPTYCRKSHRQRAYEERKFGVKNLRGSRRKPKK